MVILFCKLMKQVHLIPPSIKSMQFSRFLKNGSMLPASLVSVLSVVQTFHGICNNINYYIDCLDEVLVFVYKLISVRTKHMILSIGKSDCSNILCHIGYIFGCKVGYNSNGGFSGLLTSLDDILPSC